MSTIIQRTNPDPLPKSRCQGWACCVCQNKFDDKEEARQCAVTDHATGRHRRRRLAEVVDLNPNKQGEK